LGADAAVVVPVGSWGDYTRIGIGGLAKVSWAPWAGTRWTVRSGYISHLTNEYSDDFTVSSAEIPVFVGWQEVFAHGFYAAVEFGPVIIHEKFTRTAGGVEKFNDSQTVVRAGGTFGVGITGVGDFVDLGVCVFSPMAYHPDFSSAFGIMLSLGIMTEF